METIKETTKETFWQFLAENKIEIPMIQRDYAQGRKGKEKLRETFLLELKAALGEGGKTVTLDFVYGTKSNGVMTPLDGQQRLTTLWLLHWYVACRAQALTAAVVHRLKRFTYATRMSSRLFCEKLTEFSDLPTTGKSIRKHLENQTWFRKQWRHDPTIQAMLGMISGYGESSLSQNVGKTGDSDRSCLEGVFASCTKGDYECYWKKLSGAECPITFYCLDLPGLRRSDDLYIKMNARGKPLTSFENFKADLVAHIKEIDPSRQGLAHLETGFSIKLDTVWADKIFWPLRVKDGAYEGIWDGRIDDIVFAFFNRYCANVCAVSDKDGLAKDEKDKYAENLKALCGQDLGTDGDIRIAYMGFDDYRNVLDLDRLDELRRIFDAYDASLGSYSRYGVKFVPRYAEDKTEKIVDAAGVEIPRVVPITQKGRIIFHAFCRFFANEKLPSDSDQRKSAFEDWMRVTWNIVENYGVSSDSTMISCMKLIHELSAHSHEILSFLTSNHPKSECGSEGGKAQLEEEIEKAKQILNPDGSRRAYDGSLSEFQGKSWNEVIDEVEKFAFFNGAIRFLFHNPDGTIDWPKFDEKLRNAKRYFDAGGVSEKYRKSALLLRAFLARQVLVKKKDCWSESGEWFGNGKDFWRERVLLNANCAYAVAELLTIHELTEDCAIPQTDAVPDWIRDEKLLADAIDSCSPNLGWHIIRGWRGCARTLTRYSRKESGNVSCPYQIIPLDLLRNDLMAGFESDQKRGSKYFIGWNKNIDFVYRGCKFQWRYEGDARDRMFVYLKNGENEKIDEARRFEVQKESKMTQEEFKRELDGLIDSCEA